ncbi:MAG: isoleucine--tRNA ligase, partial [Nitrospirae bacterium]
EKGALVGRGEITHSYPHCWRCKKPVIFRATEQWFISVEHKDLRNRCLQAIDRVKWVPHWGVHRIKSMVQVRPDWCISRQRAWGVPITVISCAKCGEEVKDERVFNRIIERIKSEGADVWFSTPAEEFLPEGYTCSCGSKEFVKEKDILDVWFDSGVSHAAVLEKDERLSWPAFMYLEGSDQHRGWFQSSLFTSVATRQRAPYDLVLTHGFVVDGQGRKMSKSLGNVISPEEIIKVNGAEILRLWVSAEDYRGDVRLSKEILARLIEAYRKIRNTCRFMLGNLYDFEDPQGQTPQLREIDRWIMHRLQKLIERVTKAYEDFEFHEVFHRIYNFCVVDLSAFYLDILKDCLYVSAPWSSARRSAQWTIYNILKDLTRLMAPVLSFTAEEIWQHIPLSQKAESVFLEGFPEPRKEFINDELETKWAQLIEVREAVYRVLETKRAEKFIGNFLEAKVSLYAGGSLYDLLKEKEALLQEVLIVSQVELFSDSDAPEDAVKDETLPLHIKVTKAEGQKCSRCWNYSPTVGTFEDEVEVCERCYGVLKEING